MSAGLTAKENILYVLFGVSIEWRERIGKYIGLFFPVTLEFEKQPKYDPGPDR